MATSVLLATEVPLWHAVAGDGGKYSNAHPDRPKREALSCLQYSGLRLTWKRAMRAFSLLGIQRMSARYSFISLSISVNCFLVRPIKQRSRSAEGLCRVCTLSPWSGQRRKWCAACSVVNFSE